MNIYAILSSKPHNSHYLNRYIKFIHACQVKNIDFEGYTEKHHICPKAKDLFPEYNDFKKHPWNCVVLTTRQHYIAHILLWKAYPEAKSMCYAAWIKTHKNENRINSKTYSALVESQRAVNSLIQREKVKNGTHHLLSGEIQKETNRKRVEDGTHNWLGGEYQKELVKNGTHHFLGPENNRKRVEDGTHNWLGDGELQRNIQQKRLEEGTHPFQKGAPCVNKQGEIKYVPKSVFEKDDEWVSISSKEGKKRVGNTKKSYLKGKVRVIDKEGNITAIDPNVFWDLKYKNDDTFVAIVSSEGRKRLGKDDHPCKNKVTIVDKDGKIYNIDKELYDNNVYVTVRSKEGQRRLGKDYIKKLECIDKNGNRISLSSEEYEKQKKTDNPTDWEFVVIASKEGKRRRRRNKSPIPNNLEQFF